MRWTRSIALLAAVTFTGSACASGSSVDMMAETPEPAPVTFEIDNSLEPAQGVATMIVWDDRNDDEALGAIPAMGAEVFWWTPTAPQDDSFRLVATDRDGRQRVSQPFSLVDVSHVSWDIGEDVLAVIEAPER